MWKPSITTDDVIRHSALKHSAKGSHWKKHKYIEIVNGHYVYPGEHYDPTAKAAEKVTALKEITKIKRKAGKTAEAEQQKGFNRTVEEQERKRIEKYENAAEAAQQKGFKRTIDEQQARRDEKAARNKQAQETASKYQHQGMKRTKDVKEAKQEKYRRARETAKNLDRQGAERTAKEYAFGANNMSDYRAKRDKHLARQKAEYKKLRSDRINEGNLERARAKARSERLAAERNAEGRNAVKRQQNAARLRDQRNAAGRLSARKQIAEDNKNAARLRDQRNAAGRLSARKQIATGNQKRIAYSVRNQGRHINANMVNGASDTRRTTAMRRSLGLKQRVNNIKSIKNPTARKNQTRALAEETFYKNVKRPINKAAKSVSAAAREAWNTASSYKDRFSDFESFYKWYKKNRK